jgi:uncharacterized protein (TIGR03083 family)
MLAGERPSAPAGAGADAAHVRNDIGKANEQWIETYRGWDGPRLLEEFRAVTGRRLDILSAMTTADWDKEGFTPEGPGPYRVFMEIRLFDCWYHDQDIREALGRPGFLDGPVADLSVGRIPAKALGYVVGKKVGAPPGSVVAFEITGATPINAAVVVPPEGRAVVLDAPPEEPTVRLAMDRRTFTRLAGGRWSGEHARAHGTVRIDGDAELGNRVVDHLAFTI